MQTRRYVPFSLLAGIFLLVSALLAACGTSSGNTGGGGSNGVPVDVSIGLGYVHDVQFSPFYVAIQKGYYKAAGLNVTTHPGIVTDLFGELVADRHTFIFASGDEVLEARSKNLPVVDVSTLYQRYPVSLIVPDNSPIKTLADLKGHSIGEPGPYGATHTGLLALLHQAGLTPPDVRLESIGFNQVDFLKQGRVDAVVGYTNNEPLQLRRLGLPVRTFDVSDYQPMISNGIVVSEKTLQERKPMVDAFVQATLKGLADVITDPAGAVQTSKSYIPGMNVDTAMAELEATIPIWQGDGKHPAGYNDSATWQAMAQFLASQQMIPASLDISKAFVSS